MKNNNFFDICAGEFGIALLNERSFSCAWYITSAPMNYSLQIVYRAIEEMIYLPKKMKRWCELGSIMSHY